MPEGSLAGSLVPRLVAGRGSGQGCVLRRAAFLFFVTAAVCRDRQVCSVVAAPIAAAVTAASSP